MDRLGAGLVVAARAAHGTVEAIESTRHRFALGVQWHPEMGADAPAVRALVAAAGSAGGTAPARTAGRNARTVRSVPGRTFPARVP
ncbi:gamma-glutamyl-gamma-aminobutyrate hydrolase family protein [Streptomyces sp. NPDC059874]|uniref:gamma-glutamyl-gamma-aminobutyrate hydrolase family protein n=1 Tax=Streptomyces sp. NPDC059874 TaxID=3346983 RepID=UPI003666ED5A